MEKEKMKELLSDLNHVCTKHSLKDASFCATEIGGEREFVGLVGVDKDKISIEDEWSISLNVGRLWQHIRNAVRETLNRYEINKKDWR